MRHCIGQLRRKIRHMQFPFMQRRHYIFTIPLCNKKINALFQAFRPTSFLKQRLWIIDNKYNINIGIELLILKVHLFINY